MKPVLFVLNIGEAGLRSILAARLSLSGMDVISVLDLEDATLNKMLRERAVLILDEIAIERLTDATLDRFVAGDRWTEIVVVSRQMPEGKENCRRPCFVERGEAAARITELAQAWFGKP